MARPQQTQPGRPLISPLMGDASLAASLAQTVRREPGRERKYVRAPDPDQGGGGPESASVGCDTISHRFDADRASLALGVPIFLRAAIVSSGKPSNGHFIVFTNAATAESAS